MNVLIATVNRTAQTTSVDTIVPVIADTEGAQQTISIVMVKKQLRFVYEV